MQFSWLAVQLRNWSGEGGASGGCGQQERQPWSRSGIQGDTEPPCAPPSAQAQRRPPHLSRSALSPPLQVPTTVHPASTASWTASCPVPPAAAVTSTVWPLRCKVGAGAGWEGGLGSARPACRLLVHAHRSQRQPVRSAAALSTPAHPAALTSPACSSAMLAVRPDVISATISGAAAGTANACLAATTAHSAKPPYVMVATGCPTASPCGE